MLVAAVLSRPRGQLPIRFKCGSTHFTVTGVWNSATSWALLRLKPWADCSFL